MHQDHLSGTSLMTSWNGTSLGMMKYYPYGSTRSGEVPTDKLFTGQRYDDTGLYYYGARYYDPEIGWFISADTIVPDFINPQTFNRYSYCLNNPLKYTDPSGHDLYDEQGNNIEETDTILKAYALLTIYGHSVDINIGEFMTEGYMFVNELRKIERETVEGLSLFGAEDPSIDDYVQDEKDWILVPSKSGGYEISLPGGKQSTWWNETGNILFGSAELTLGIITTIYFGLMFLGGPTTWFTIPWYISAAIIPYSTTVAIDGWNRLTPDEYYIDSNLVTFSTPSP